MILDPARGPSRVDVISGSFGAGHDAAAREIVARLRSQGHEVRVHDVVDHFPWRLGRLLRAAYLMQLAVSPRSWGMLLHQLQPGRPLHRLVSAVLGRLPARRLLAAVAGTDLVIATHPFAGQALGHLRTTGGLRAPAVTYLTDLSVHALWVHRGVDLHLALHEVAAAQACALGGEVEVIEPLVPQVYAAPPAEADAVRARIGLAPGTAYALIVGGSLGIGELEAAALDVAATGVRPVVVCGTNDRLRRRLSRHAAVVALGWRDDLPDLIRAAGCVVQNAGGFTSLEALAAGVPVLTYRCLPGHGMTNAAALEAAGLAAWVRTPVELAAALTVAVSSTVGQAIGLRPVRPSSRSLVDALSVPPLAASA